MKAFNFYLNFDGNAEEAFNFYKSVFGGKFESFQRMKEAPESDKLTAKEQKRVMHVSLPIGNGVYLMASDIIPSMGHKLTYGNNFYISLSTESKAEADRLYNGLSSGGTIEMPLADTFWGAYFGIFKDKFGIQWILNFDYEKKN